MPNIEITATGNVTSAVAAMKVLDKTLEDVAKSGGNLNPVLEKVNKIVADFGKNTSIPTVSNEIKKLQETSKNAGVSLKDLALNSTVPFSTLVSTVNKSKEAISGAVSINKQFADSAALVAEKNRILSSNIQLAIDKLSAVHDSSKKADSGIQVFGKGIAELLPMLIGPVGLGIAFSAISIAIELFKDEVHHVDLSALVNRLEESKKSQKEFEDAVNSASKSVVSQAKDINDLSTILVSTTGDIQNLTIATINQGVAAFLFDKKNVEVQKLLSAEIEKQIKLRKQNSPLAGTAFIEGAFSKDKTTREIAEAKAAILGLNELSQGLESIFASLLNGSDKASKAAKSIRTIADVLADLEKQITFLNSKELILNTNEAKGKLSALQSAFDELVKNFKLTGKSPIIIDIVARINRIEFEQLSGDFISRERENIKKNVEKRISGTDKPILVKTHVKFEMEAAGIDKDLFKFQDDVNGAINKAFANIAAGIVNSFATTIGEALASGNFSVPDLFGGLIKGIGEQLKSLGEYMVQIGVEYLVLKKALAALKLNPVLTIAAGFALEILGSALLASANNRTPKGFATGTTNSPGGSFLVGERGPEMITLPQGSKVATNGQLNAMGGGGEIVVGELRLNGLEMVALVKKVNAYNSRNGF